MLDQVLGCVPDTNDVYLPGKGAGGSQITMSHRTRGAGRGALCSSSSALTRCLAMNSQPILRGVCRLPEGSALVTDADEEVRDAVPVISESQS